MQCLVCQSSVEPFQRFPRMPLYSKPVPEKGVGRTIPLDIAFCRQCNHMSSQMVGVENVDEEIEKLYRAYNSYAPHLSQRQKQYAGHLVEWLDARMEGKKGRVLEVGSHDGAFLNMLKQRGHECQGVEPSGYGKLGKELYDIDTKIEFLTEGLFPAESFDLVICRHVLEHVPRPVDFLKMLSTFAKKGGLVYLEVPNSYQSLQERIFAEFHIDHISYFTIPSLLYAAGRTEKLESIHLESSYASMKYPFIHALFRKTDSPAPIPRNWLLTTSIDAGIEQFTSSYETLVRSLKFLGKGKIGMWGAGPVGTQFAIDGEWTEDAVTIVDPAETNQGKHLSVLGYPIHHPRVILERGIERVVIATGWESDALRQAREAYKGTKVQLLLLSDLVSGTLASA